jgi:hypothetical protein
MRRKRKRRDASAIDLQSRFDYVLAWLERMAEGASERVLVFEADLENGKYLRAERWPSREAFLAANCLTTLDLMREAAWEKPRATNKKAR